MADSDVDLVARVLLEDDRAAFAELVNRHQGKVRGLLRRLCHNDLALADDLAQETFLRIYRGLRTFHGKAGFSTWIYRVTYNVFLNHAATATARATLDTRSATDGIDRELTAKDTPDRAIARHDIERAFTQLNPEERAALTLSYGHGCSHEEIATIVDLPMGTVKSLILRGKAKLKMLLAPDARNSEAAS